MRRGVRCFCQPSVLQGGTAWAADLLAEDLVGELEIPSENLRIGDGRLYRPYITPQATVDDGLLDVTILEPFTALDVPQLAYQLFHKTIDQNSCIKTFRCQHLKIHRRKPGVVHYDGDPVPKKIRPMCSNVPKTTSTAWNN